ncbi:MAG: toprim domain-containing protein [Pseudomonadota bacterium]
MSSQAADLARRLARDAEAVCRHYLPNGRRHGRYWLVGDVRNTPGRSLYVRLTGPESGPGAAGKWTDAATGEHGDLLDLIALNRGLDAFRDVLDEARRFLWLPRSEPAHPTREPPPPAGSPEAARRLFRAGRPVAGTQAEAYLRARGITARLDWPSLRFHSALWYRSDRDAARESWPGLLAAVTDADGRITGVHRTWLDRQCPEKAPLADPRRALGQLLGNGVRFGRAIDVLAAGEGIETMLALKSVLPDLPMIAALSANHLAALDLAPMLARLYVARDRDAAGRMAAERLHARGRDAGIEVRDLMPARSDFNVDLRRLGPDVMLARLADQLAPADVLRFLRRRDAA